MACIFLFTHWIVLVIPYVDSLGDWLAIGVSNNTPCYRIYFVHDVERILCGSL